MCWYLGRRRPWHGMEPCQPWPDHCARCSGRWRLEHSDSAPCGARDRCRCAALGAVETGGALVGRISFENRTITIAGLVEAPSDSVREAARFVLGTSGLVQSLRAANAASLGYLAFIGTWHSHPKGGAHSGIDRNTLRSIAEDAGGLPAVSLVWTPTGLTCAVDRW